MVITRQVLQITSSLLVRVAGRLEELKLRLTQSILARTGAELGKNVTG